MKKILAVLLCLCMFVGCAFAEPAGYQAHVTVNYQGENLADVIAQIAQDEDGCAQLSFNGTIDGEAQNVFLQIGKDALVLGSDGEYVQIDYATLIEALKDALPEVLGEEGMMIVGALYYLFTDFEQDKPVFEELLQNEASRLVNLAMAQGIITVSLSGEVTIEADQDQLLELVKAYIQALSEDDAVFAKLAGTKLWGYLGLSQNGANEQAYVAQLSKNIADYKFDGSFRFYIKAVLQTRTGDIDALIQFSYLDKCDLSFTAKTEGGKVKLTLAGSIEEAIIDAACDIDETGLAFTANVHDDKGNNLDAAYTLALDGSVLGCECSYAGTIEGDEFAFTGTASFDFGSYAFKEDAKLVYNGYTTTLKTSLDCVNGLDYALETDMLGTFNAVYAKANAQKTEYGFAANANVDAVLHGQNVDDLFALDLLMTDDRLNLTSHLKGIDLNQFNYGNVYTKNIYDAKLELNLDTFEVDAALTLEDATYTLKGTISGDIYTLVLAQNNYTLGTAELTLTPGKPAIYNILFGDLTVKLYDGTVITRTTAMSDKLISCVYTITTGGRTQTIEIGLRDKSEGGRYNYEAYVSSQGMEYNAGVVFEQGAELIYGEFYVNMVMGTMVRNMIDVIVELTPINETPAHASGYPMPKDTLQSMLTYGLKEIRKTLRRAFR